jgi:anti-sigma B factor antagonist
MNREIVPGFDSETENSIKLRLQGIDEVPGGLAIYATGYIDTYNSTSFLKRAEKAVAAGFARLILDLSSVSFISSTGVGALVSLLKLARQRNGDVILQSVQPRVYEVLQLLGFSQFFPIKENLEESLAYLAGHSNRETFPKVFACPICNRRLRATKSGRFRCVQCRTILEVDKAAMVLVG